MSVLFYLRGLQTTVPASSSIYTAYLGKQHLAWVVIKHRDHMNTSYVNITKIIYIYMSINIVNLLLKPYCFIYVHWLFCLVIYNSKNTSL